jgi:DNA ligase-1
MLRSPEGRYKFGRSTLKEGILLKWKRFHDDKAGIIGFEEKMHNANQAAEDELGYTKRSTSKVGMIPAGTLGALLVKNKTGVSFAIGTGFDDAMRKVIWESRDQHIGRLVTFTYQELSRYGVPRFPVFKGFRPEVE